MSFILAMKVPISNRKGITFVLGHPNPLEVRGVLDSARKIEGLFPGGEKRSTVFSYFDVETEQR